MCISWLSQSVQGSSPKLFFRFEIFQALRVDLEIFIFELGAICSAATEHFDLLIRSDKWVRQGKSSCLAHLFLGDVLDLASTFCGEAKLLAHQAKLNRLILKTAKANDFRLFGVKH